MKTFLFSLCFVFHFALASNESNKFGSLFRESETIKFDFQYDISQMQKEKQNLKDVGVSGQILVEGKQLQVEVMSRGGGSMSCTQPQLKINFKNSVSAETPFHGFKKVRLFTTGLCVDAKTDEASNKRILANYLHYKLFERVSPFHFKTRLVEISYADSSGQIPPYKQLAFFLEPDNHLKERLGLTKIEDREIAPILPQVVEKIEAEQLSRVNAFQVLIGNFDFAIPGMPSPLFKNETHPISKNSNLYQNASGKFFPLIYDFDFSRFTYYHGVCWLSVSMRSILEGRMNLSHTCPESDILHSIVDDIKFTSFQADATKHTAHLNNAIAEWSSLNKEHLDRLGFEYLDGVKLVMKMFTQATSTIEN